MSLRWAELARELPRGQGGLVIAERRLADIALHAAPDIVTALTERVLRPLAGESERSRARLEDTLLAWLRSMAPSMRSPTSWPCTRRPFVIGCSRLRDLFGDALEDPDLRFELEIALRNKALAPGPHRSA